MAGQRKGRTEIVWRECSARKRKGRNEKRIDDVRQNRTRQGRKITDTGMIRISVGKGQEGTC